MSRKNQTSLRVFLLILSWKTYKKKSLQSHLRNGHFQFPNWVGNTASIQQVQSNKQPVKNDSDREVIALSSSVELLSSLMAAPLGDNTLLPSFVGFLLYQQ